MLVALLGPDRVTEALLGILESDAESLRPRQTTSALLDLFHLLPEDVVEAHRKRLRSWCEGKSKDVVREISWCISPEENLAKEIARPDSRAEFYRRIGRGVPQTEIDAAIAREFLLGSNDVFIGPTEKILKKVAILRGYLLEIGYLAAQAFVAFNLLVFLAFVSNGAFETLPFVNLRKLSKR